VAVGPWTDRGVAGYQSPPPRTEADSGPRVPEQYRSKEIAVARVRIHRKDGRPTPFFWRKKRGEDPTRQTVYKRTAEGIKRMKGVHFNVKTNEFEKEPS
jgi:hypothetical protein